MAAQLFGQGCGGAREDGVSGQAGAYLEAVVGEVTDKLLRVDTLDLKCGIDCGFRALPVGHVNEDNGMTVALPLSFQIKKWGGLNAEALLAERLLQSKKSSGIFSTKKN